MITRYTIFQDLKNRSDLRVSILIAKYGNDLYKFESSDFNFHL